MPLLASRFLLTGRSAIDLATARPVTLRDLPTCDAADERRWMDACSQHQRLWHEDLPALVDHGFTSEGRFEAYDIRPDAQRTAAANAAVRAFLLDGRPPDEGTGATPNPISSGSRRERDGLARGEARVRFGMHLLDPAPLVPFIEVLEDGRCGCPVRVTCHAEEGAGATTFLRIAAVAARRRGYVPVSVNTLERWPELLGAVRQRTCVLLCDGTDAARRADRWFLRLTALAARSHVLLRIDRRDRGGADVRLALAPFDADALAEAVSVYPRGRLCRSELRRAALDSAGVPGAFLSRLRDGAGSRTLLHVAEAHVAYEPDEDPALGEVEHPWRDLIAAATRLAASGRRAAAERDLRQIAGAARRRQVRLASDAAELELGLLLLARGRVDAARQAFATCGADRVEHGALAYRAALGLAMVHLESGDLESAESLFRVTRADEPHAGALGLAWALLWQRRTDEAARVLATARQANDPSMRARADVASAALALACHDLPGAVRLAAQAWSDGEVLGDAATLAAAGEVLVLAYGQVGDKEAVERYARQALAAARRAGAPLAALKLRAARLEARHACAANTDGVALARLLKLSANVPVLLRGRLWGVAARIHPNERERREYHARVLDLVRMTGARALLPETTEPPGAALARDMAELTAIEQSAPTPDAALTRVAHWVCGRLEARSAVITDASGATLTRSGPRDTVRAVSRVLLTRLPQPPWIAPDGLESAVIVRCAGEVRGVLACRWPLSRHVSTDAIAILTTAAVVLGPALTAMAERLAARPSASDGIVGRSRAIERLRELIARAGAAPFAVLVEGESGVGKELVARGIHQGSSRRLRPFVAVNCAAFTDDLFEAEVFGHARGAFTGAHAERVGLFEQADGGILFLDEVSELSARAQAKLLRALQEGEVRRLGENHARRVDVRVISASNRRLEEDVQTGRFRKDLLFRLAVIRIAVPPLRERPEDIPLLAAHYWEAAARRASSRAVLTAAAVASLAQHEWLGNVRELQNVMAALAVHVPRGRVGGDHVSAFIGTPHNPVRQDAEPPAGTLDQARRAFERQFVAAVLARCGGRHSAAARQLGLSRQGLAKLLRRLELRV